MTLTINCIKTSLAKKDHATEVINFTKTYLAKDDNELCIGIKTPQIW